VIGLTLGFNGCWTPCFNWGIEGRANWSNMKSTFDQDYTDSVSEAATDHFQAKLDQQYGVVAKLGWLPAKCTQLYVFVGPQWGDFKVSASASDTFAIGATTYAAGVSHDHSKFKTGLLAGLGFEQMVNDCVSVALEYDYGNYGSVSGNAFGNYIVAGALDSTTSFNKNSSAKVITNSMVLKFNYYFA
jgi:opacity protein-like surface antigen